MKYSDFVKRLVMLVLLVAPLALMGTPSFAQDLVALNSTATMPDGTVIPMWGFFTDTGQLCSEVPQWEPGPPLNALSGDTLTVNLRNCLDDPVSIFIPGQLKALVPVHEDTDGSGRMRVTSFDTITAPTAVGSYQWTGVKEGTYLYHSGTHPQVQVQMGLYGVLVVVNGTYPPFAQDEVLLFSEIDPALHTAVDDLTYGTPAYPSTFDYQPKYFLINGRSFPDTLDIALNTSEDVLLRFVNAGLKTHVPALQGPYMSVVAEDGNLYPHPKQQYSIELTAAKTMDAIVNVGTAGSYALYDRSLHLTNAAATGGGMLTYLQVGNVVGAPTAGDDAYATDEDTPLIVAVPGVLGNDTDDVGPLSAVIVSLPSAGALTLNNDGSLNYIPNADFNGIDLFTYKASDGVNLSNLATVTITVNPLDDLPVAMDDAYDAIEGETLIVAAPGVLANDVDVDGDLLTASPVGTPPGVLVLNPDGSFDYTPAGAAGAVETFDYTADDGMTPSLPATVTINVVVTPPNIPPFANDDFAETGKNTPVSFSVTANDVDPDGAIDVGTVALTSLITTRGGSVTVNTSGEVTFTPKRGFRGTDTFTYTVDDDEGATSNEATVRVNVLR